MACFILRTENHIFEVPRHSVDRERENEGQEHAALYLLGMKIVADHGGGDIGRRIRVFYRNDVLFASVVLQSWPYLLSRCGS